MSRPRFEQELHATCLSTAWDAHRISWRDFEYYCTIQSPQKRGARDVAGHERNDRRDGPEGSRSQSAIDGVWRLRSQLCCRQLPVSWSADNNTISLSDIDVDQRTTSPVETVDRYLTSFVVDGNSTVFAAVRRSYRMFEAMEQRIREATPNKRQNTSKREFPGPEWIGMEGALLRVYQPQGIHTQDLEPGAIVWIYICFEKK